MSRSPDVAWPVRLLRASAGQTAQATTMAKPVDPRDSGRWRALRAQLRATATHCAICQVLLDHHNPRSLRYPTVDHIQPLHLRPDLAFTPSNLRVVCASCNFAGGARLSNQIRRRRGGTNLPRRWQTPPQSGGDPGPGW